LAGYSTGPVLHNNGVQGAPDLSYLALGALVSPGLSFSGEGPNCRMGQALADIFFSFDTIFMTSFMYLCL
jgi:hypothetical protein